MVFPFSYRLPGVGFTVDRTEPNARSTRPPAKEANMVGPNHVILLPRTFLPPSSFFFTCSRSESGLGSSRELRLQGGGGGRAAPLLAAARQPGGGRCGGPAVGRCGELWTSGPARRRRGAAADGWRCGEIGSHRQEGPPPGSRLQRQAPRVPAPFFLFLSFFQFFYLIFFLCKNFSHEIF